MRWHGIRHIQGIVKTSVAGVSWGKGENDLRLEKLQGPDSTLSEMESTIMYYHVLREYYPDSTHQRRIWFSFSNNHSGCVQSAAWRQAWKREMRKKILRGIRVKSWCLDLGGSGGSSIYTDLYIDIYFNNFTWMGPCICWMCSLNFSCWAAPVAQWFSAACSRGVILETWDRVPHRAPCMEPASPSACVSASLSLSLNE